MVCFLLLSHFIVKKTLIHKSLGRFATEYFSYSLCVVFLRNLKSYLSRKRLKKNLLKELLHCCGLDLIKATVKLEK